MAALIPASWGCTARTVQIRVGPEAQPSFADVAPDSWYYAYVETAARAGIVQGDGGRFRPQD